MKPPIDNFKLEKYPAGSVTQWFGENETLYRRWGLAGHNGIDIVAPHGSPLYAVEDAVVYSVKHSPDGYGKYFRLRTHKHEWTYGHCSDIHVEVGQKVKAGEHVADMGNTGFVVSGATPFWKVNPFAGTHLHLGLRMLKGGTVLNHSNGYMGSVDPYPLLANLTPEETDHRKLQLTLISVLNTLIKLLS